MPIEELINLAIAASSLVTAVATVLIAWAAHRFSKAQVRQDREASVRQSFGEWNLELDQQIPQAAPAQLATESAVRNNPALDRLNSLNADTRRLDSMLAVLRGHVWWLRHVADPEDSWINRFDDMDGNDDEVISAMLNGVLDSVKDDVLFFDGSESDDFNWIVDTFWTETHFRATDIAHLEAVFRSESDLERQVVLGVAKWAKRGAPDEALTRITELVRYRIQIELSFRTFFVGTFTYSSYGATSSTSRKFRDGMRSATSKIRADINGEFEELLLELK